MSAYDEVFQFLQASLAHQFILRVELVEILLVQSIFNTIKEHDIKQKTRNAQNHRKQKTDGT